MSRTIARIKKHSGQGSQKGDRAKAPWTLVLWYTSRQFQVTLDWRTSVGKHSRRVLMSLRVKTTSYSIIRTYDVPVRLTDSSALHVSSAWRLCGIKVLPAESSQKHDNRKINRWEGMGAWWQCCFGKGLFLDDVQDLQCCCPGRIRWWNFL